MIKRMPVIVAGALLLASSAVAQGLAPGPQRAARVGPATQPMPRDTQWHASELHSPEAWCMRSPEPSHCRGRAVVENNICKDNPHYGDCRRAIDQMHNTK